MNKDDIFLLFHSSLSPRAYSEDNSLDLPQKRTQMSYPLSHMWVTIFSYFSVRVVSALFL